MMEVTLALRETAKTAKSPSTAYLLRNLGRMPPLMMSLSFAPPLRRRRALASSWLPERS